MILPHTISIHKLWMPLSGNILQIGIFPFNLSYLCSVAVLIQYERTCHQTVPVCSFIMLLHTEAWQTQVGRCGFCGAWAGFRGSDPCFDPLLVIFNGKLCFKGWQNDYFFTYHSTALQLTQLHLSGAFTALNVLAGNLWGAYNGGCNEANAC